MDRTLFRVLVVLAVASVIFLAAISITVFVEITYRATLSSTYEYRVSITSDATLGNVTLYVPIPARGPKSSSVLEGIGSGGLKGVPPSWGVSLIGTEKFTMLELTAREIEPSPPGRPYLLSFDTRVRGPIHTRTAGSEDLVLRSVTQVIPAACGGMDTEASPEMRCWLYQGPAYADFTAPGNEHLSVQVSLTGRNAWDVFGPSSNEYRDGLQFSFSGERRGWRTGDGSLVTGIGDYGIEPWLQHWETPESSAGVSQQLVMWPLQLRGGWA